MRANGLVAIVLIAFYLQASRASSEEEKQDPGNINVIFLILIM